MKLLSKFYLLLLSFNIYCANFNVIGEIVVSDWKSELPEASFIEANEQSPFYFLPILKDRKGIMFSVGTFRALIDFSWGDFSYLFMIDYDQRVLDFNRKHLQFIINLTKIYPGLTQKQRDEYVKSEYGQYIKQANFNTSEIPYYWENDKYWQRITETLNENKIFVVKADLYNNHNNKKLIAAINNTPEFKNKDVTIDISNIVSANPYFCTGDGLGSGLLDALNSFANHPQKDLILMTSQIDLNKMPFGPHKLGSFVPWDYFASTLQEFSKFYIKLGEDARRRLETGEKSLCLF